MSAKPPTKRTPEEEQQRLAQLKDRVRTLKKQQPAAAEAALAAPAAPAAEKRPAPATPRKKTAPAASKEKETTSIAREPAASPFPFPIPQVTQPAIPAQKPASLANDDIFGSTAETEFEKTRRIIEEKRRQLAAMRSGETPSVPLPQPEETQSAPEETPPPSQQDDTESDFDKTRQIIEAKRHQLAAARSNTMPPPPPAEPSEAEDGQEEDTQAASTAQESVWLGESREQDTRAEEPVLDSRRKEAVTSRLDQLREQIEARRRTESEAPVSRQTPQYEPPPPPPAPRSPQPAPVVSPPPAAETPKVMQPWEVPAWQKPEPEERAPVSRQAAPTTAAPQPAPRKPEGLRLSRTHQKLAKRLFAIALWSLFLLLAGRFAILLLMGNARIPFDILSGSHWQLMRRAYDAGHNIPLKLVGGILGLGFVWLFGCVGMWKAGWKYTEKPYGIIAGPLSSLFGKILSKVRKT